MSTKLRLGGLAWVLTLVYFAGQAVAQVAWRTPFSLVDNRVSDLGATSCGTALTGAFICSPLHAVMNATLVVTGLLLLAGMVLVRGAWPRRRLTTWGLVMLAIAGAGTVLVGLAPENVSMPLHLLGALNIPCGNLAMLLLGLAAWNTDRARAWLSLALAAIGFLGIVAGPLLVVLTGHGGGLAERVALYPLIAWAAVTGASLLRSADDGSPVSRPASWHTSR